LRVPPAQPTKKLAPPAAPTFGVAPTEPGGGNSSVACPRPSRAAIRPATRANPTVVSFGAAASFRGPRFTRASACRPAASGSAVRPVIVLFKRDFLSVRAPTAPLEKSQPTSTPTERSITCVATLSLRGLGCPIPRRPLLRDLAARKCATKARAPTEHGHIPAA